MDFKEYLSNLYISLLLPNEFYNQIDKTNKNINNFKKIRLSITAISYDNLTQTKDIINFKKNNIIPLIIDCNNKYFKNIINNLFDLLKINLNLYYDNNLHKIIYFIKYNEKYNQLINSFLIIFPLFNKLCEVLSLNYSRYPILNISSINNKLNLLFLKSRNYEDKDKYFYNCKYINNDINFICNVYYDLLENMNFDILFNKIN